MSGDRDATELVIRVDPTDDGPVVGLGGDLDMATTPQLDGCLAGIARRRPDRIVVDLAELRFCDSTGLTTFVRWSRQCSDAGVQLLLRAPTPQLRRLLEITRFDSLLDVDSDGAVTGGDSDATVTEG
ncbi:MAG: STAS domain-containing protein [Mycobacteriaceae bacterium]|nr:STAS domain-containing protein [Actinomycetota bacterium]MBV9514254.1 STAS domain-containing protein [Mycobacteriaceae bacterium]